MHQLHGNEVNCGRMDGRHIRKYEESMHQAQEEDFSRGQKINTATMGSKAVQGYETKIKSRKNDEKSKDNGKKSHGKGTELQVVKTKPQLKGVQGQREP